MFKSLISIVAAATAMFAFTACNSSDDSDTGNQYADIVTLESTAPSGSVMTFREKDDSPLITLTTTQAFSTEIFTPGTRILAIYHPESNKRGESGPVTVAAASPTLGKGSAPVPAVVDTLDNWASDRIVMPGESVWRSGYYLNMAFQAISTATPKKFYVYVDEKTVDSEYPELHVVFKSGNSSSMYNFAFYASYNIAGLWNRPGVNGVKVYYFNDGAMMPSCVTIDKTSEITPSPNPDK